MTSRPLYFDCDTGIDDSLALAFLLASPEIDLVGVGTVSGNIDAEQAAVNTLDLIALAGKTGIPVALGAHDHLSHPYDGGVPHIHGRNGVGNIELPASGLSTVEETAAEMIVRLSREYAGELELVAVGPLTNVALALALDPTIVERVTTVTIMGGAAYASGNVTPVAEANIYNDAEAAALVLAAGWPVVLVPLDVTIENILEEEDRDTLLNSGIPIAVALGEMLDLYFGFYVELYGRRSCSLHDPLAAAIAVGTVVATNAPAVAVVVDASDGPGRGQTICDLRDQRLGARDQPGATVRVVLDTDVPLAPLLIERLLTL
jgi:purine nucleosidase